MSNIPAIPQADLALLRKYDTATVSNVVELFDLIPQTAGYMDARIQACYPKLPPMVGYAATATFRSAAPPKSGNVYSGLVDQLAAFAELPGPPIVVFQDLDSPVAAATFGEIMCTAYKAFGAVGLITSGAGRDLDQVERLDFPCFTSGTICAHGYCHIVQINVPVHVGNVMVAPGDLLHGDRNGVTAVPNRIASAVAHACSEFMKAEDIILGYLKSDKVNTKEFVAAQKECREMNRKLGERLRASVGKG